MAEANQSDPKNQNYEPRTTDSGKALLNYENALPATDQLHPKNVTERRLAGSVWLKSVVSTELARGTDAEVPAPTEAQTTAAAIEAGQRFRAALSVDEATTYEKSKSDDPRDRAESLFGTGTTAEDAAKRVNDAVGFAEKGGPLNPESALGVKLTEAQQVFGGTPAGAPAEAAPVPVAPIEMGPVA